MRRRLDDRPAATREDTAHYTAGSFVAPPAYAEEMYNPALQGRSSGGRFAVDRQR
ncbi:MAG TPA: hypothetical protein VFJ20_08490 [Gemmatimonadaceae bacterium]|nr:hypothetical protein [Gemmatimonadaceae bacterium]